MYCIDAARKGGRRRCIQRKESVQKDVVLAYVLNDLVFQGLGFPTSAVSVQFGPVSLFQSVSITAMIACDMC